MTDAADLHAHTIHSDGTATPAEVVHLAVDAGLAFIALTDHDTVAGVPEALAAARDAPLHVVPGLEVCAQHEGGETHIIGLFIRPDDAALTDALAAKRDERRVRAERIANVLADLGAPIDLDRVLDGPARQNPSRIHIAQALIEAGHAQSIQRAFDLYIGEGRPAYIPRTRFSVAEACALIREAGGLPILAHPVGLTRDGLASMVDEGIGAVEAYNPGFNPAWSRRLRQWAGERDLGISGGSDYHGGHRPGATIGSVRVPLEYVEDLQRRCVAYRLPKS